jgi:virulence-associated protein VagC
MKTNSLKNNIKATTRTFKSGNSIAVRIPHEFNLEVGKTLEIKRRGRELILVEHEETLAGLIDVFKSFPADAFAEEISDPPPTPIEALDAPIQRKVRLGKSRTDTGNAVLAKKRRTT